jgi:hypothetical protein
MKLVDTGRFFRSGFRGRIPRFLQRLIVGRMGAVPGMVRILLPDLRLAWLMGRTFEHLQMDRRSPLTVVQREMVATVVNGLIGGAP